MFPSKRTKGSSRLVEVQVEGRRNSSEVFASECCADPDALALLRCTTRARDSMKNSSSCITLTVIDNHNMVEEFGVSIIIIKISNVNMCILCDLNFKGAVFES